MAVWIVVGAVVVGAIAGVVRVAVLFHRAWKEIDLVDLDTEYL